MGKIKLNDGTEYNGSAIKDEDILWVDLSGVSLQECYMDLMDVEKTSHIVVDQYNVKNTYEGYSHVFYLRETDGTKVSVGLLQVNEDNK